MSVGHDWSLQQADISAVPELRFVAQDTGKGMKGERPRCGVSSMQSYSLDLTYLLMAVYSG